MQVPQGCSLVFSHWNGLKYKSSNNHIRNGILLAFPTSHNYKRKPDGTSLKNKLLHTHVRVYYQPWTVTLDDLSSVLTDAAPLSFCLVTNQKPTCKTTPFCPCPLGKNLGSFPENKTCNHFISFLIQLPEIIIKLTAHVSTCSARFMVPKIPFYFFHMNVAVLLYAMLSTPSFLKLFGSAKS